MFPSCIWSPLSLPMSTSSEKFWYWYLILAVIPLALGVMQFWSPADSVLNRYAWEGEVAQGVATFGSSTRVRITDILTSLATLFDADLSYGNIVSGFRRSKAGSIRAVWRVGIVPVANLYHRFPGTLPHSRRLSDDPPCSHSAFQQLCWTACGGDGARGTSACRPACEPSLSRSIHSVSERAQQNEDVQGRLAEVLYNPIWALAEAGPFGYGLGSTHQARAFVVSGDSERTTCPLMQRASGSGSF